MKLFRRSAPIDADIMLITDYLTRDLAEAQMRAVEERLATDFAFYRRVAPVIKVWRIPAGHFAVQPAPKTATQRRAWYRRRLVVNLVAAVFAIAVVGGGAIWFVMDVNERTQVKSDLDLTRAPSIWAKGGILVEVLPGANRTVETERGTQVTLRGEARFTYLASPKASPFAGMWASLDGEAAIEVSPTEGVVRLKTWAGQVNLAQGSYAVRCVPGCSAMLVTVGTGLATLVADSARPSVALRSGERGKLPQVGTPERVTNDTGDWPVLAAGVVEASNESRGGNQHVAQPKAKP